eukprot:11807757-Heterocapsa_arctica.AAC.1
MHAFQTEWPETKPGICDDVAEICGGSALTTQLIIRKSYRSGKNFDILVGIDLRDRREVARLWQYIQYSGPRVFIMAPPCRGLGLGSTQPRDQSRGVGAEPTTVGTHRPALW